MAEDSVRPVMAILGVLDGYHVQAVSGIAEALRRRGIPLLVVVADVTATQPLPQVIVELLRPGRVQGVIMFAAGQLAGRADLLDLLDLLDLPSGAGLPLVTLAGRIGRSPRVHGDNVTGMRALMAHLLDECGARRLLLVRGVPGFVDSQVRERVVREECGRRGLPLDDDLVVDGWFEPKPTLDRLDELLARRRDFDAVVALNDMSAFGALSALTGHGLRVPDDVLVTGFDNSSECAASWPPLTTADQHLEEQGALAVDLLLRLLAGESCPDDVEVPSELVVRASTVPGVQNPDDMAGPARALQARVTMQDLAVQIGWAMAACRSVADIVATLDPCLAQLGIRRCFLGLEQSRDDDPAGEEVRAVLAFSYLDGRVQQVTDEVFPRRELLPPSLRQELEHGSLLLQPLSVRGRARGYLLYDLNTQQSPALAEALRIEVPRAVELVFSGAELEGRAEALELLVAQHTQELARANAALRRTAMSDGLTGIANRRAFEAVLQEACGVRETSNGMVTPGTQAFAARGPANQAAGTERADGSSRRGPVSLIMIDVDAFKAYNDCYGHLAGDDALRTVAACLEGGVEGTEHLACRYGGEEFAVVMRDCDLSGALRVAERFVALMRAAAIPHETSPVGPIVTASIGVAGAASGAPVAPADLVAAADGALYLAKTQGRDRIVVASQD